jgi:hypothetical protein
LEQTGLKVATFYRRLREFRAARKGGSRIAPIKSPSNISESAGTRQIVTADTSDAENLGNSRVLQAFAGIFDGAALSKSPMQIAETIEMPQADTANISDAENLTNSRILQAFT